MCAPARSISDPKAVTERLRTQKSQCLAFAGMTKAILIALAPHISSTPIRCHICLGTASDGWAPPPRVCRGTPIFLLSRCAAHLFPMHDSSVKRCKKCPRFFWYSAWAASRPNRERFCARARDYGPRGIILRPLGGFFLSPRQFVEIISWWFAVSTRTASN